MKNKKLSITFLIIFIVTILLLTILSNLNLINELTTQILFGISMLVVIIWYISEKCGNEVKKFIEHIKNIFKR